MSLCVIFVVLPCILTTLACMFNSMCTSLLCARVCFVFVLLFFVRIFVTVYPCRCVGQPALQQQAQSAPAGCRRWLQASRERSGTPCRKQRSAGSASQTPSSSVHLGWKVTSQGETDDTDAGDWGNVWLYFICNDKSLCFNPKQTTLL